MTNIEFLFDLVDVTIDRLEVLRANGVKSESSFIISCKELDDFNYFDIREAEKFKLIFDQLRVIAGPVLYWFEIISDIDSRNVIEALINYKTSGTPKATPSLKSTINYDSKILYVGKVKGLFWGRLIQHLGFYKVNGTQGLQLFYWAKELSLDLKINIIEFDNDMADIMPIIEYAFAKRLKPLVGKHK